MKSLKELLETVKSRPETIQFNEVIEVVDSNFKFTPTAFKNGDTQNEKGQNNGSCKVFAFAQLNNLSQNETLHLFGDYYRKDVLEHPEKDDHQNIRNFIKYGWEGITFEGNALN